MFLCSYVHIQDHKKLYFVDSVDPDTIGQYTGMKDKTGRMIFEGDIIHYSNDTDYKVYWSDMDLAFYIDGINYRDNDSLCQLYEEYIDIIGNIHDNPELLG